MARPDGEAEDPRARSNGTPFPRAGTPLHGGEEDGEAVPERRVQRVSVRIHGQEYQVRSDAAPEHVQALADRLDARMRELNRANPRLGGLQVAVLVALNILDDFVRLEDQYHRVLGLLEREWERRKAGSGPEAPGGSRRP